MLLVTTTAVVTVLVPLMMSANVMTTGVLVWNIKAVTALTASAHMKLLGSILLMLMVTSTNTSNALDVVSALVILVNVHALTDMKARPANAQPAQMTALVTALVSILKTWAMLPLGMTTLNWDCTHHQRHLTTETGTDIKSVLVSATPPMVMLTALRRCAHMAMTYWT